MKNIVLLGSTGSIGTSALRVVEALPSRFAIQGIAVQRDYRKALEQAARFRVPHVAVADEAMARKCRDEAPAHVQIHVGLAGVDEVAALAGVDCVLCAVVGMAGLRPVLAAIRAGHDVALATKEVLVAAGGLVTEACRKHRVRLLPVDSEHSAVFQCIQTARPEQVRRILLTASGGPFALKSNVDFDQVTVNEALRHPRWNMGRKVTVDSATLMNKGLEIMEAHWLFEAPLETIEVVIHPESIVHSLVEFVDGSVMAQLSPPDMRFAIQYALTWPERVDGGLPALDLAKVASLHFHAPDPRRFPCLALAREAANRGGTMPAVLNAANEVAVQNFLDGRTAFSGIWRTVERVMRRHAAVDRPGLDEVMAADVWARMAANEASC